MPELPEVETVRMQLEKYLVGQSIQSIKSLHPKSVYGDSTLVVGRKIIGVRRLGKMLVLDITGKYCVAIHFKMSGQLIYLNASRKLKVAGGHPTSDWIGPLPSTHTRAVITLASGDIVYFNDQRIFGWVKIMTDKELAGLSFVQKLGPEPWSISRKEFYRRISGKKKSIKVVLLDQEILAGVGNIYANDGLWEARIDPRRASASLSMEEAGDILKGIVHVLREGVRYGGATTSDAKYVNLEGLGGTYQDHFRTYSRVGMPCLRQDAGVIEKITVGGRGTFYCPVCQK